MPLEEEYTVDVTCLNCGSKWSLKCEILAVFYRYLCSNDFHVSSTPYLYVDQCSSSMHFNNNNKS